MVRVLRLTNIADIKTSPPVKRKTRAGADDRKLGQSVKDTRLAAGVTQAALADALGLTFQQVQKYEKGTNRMGSARLKKIATALDKPIEHFYGLEEKKTKVDTLLTALRPNVAIRLLRAYSSIKDQTLRHEFVVLAERIAGLI